MRLKERQQSWLMISLTLVKTFAEAAKILERGGVKDIYAVASHGLFAGGAAEVLNAAPIKEILVTDSVATKRKSSYKR